jgi:ankyrin repeat protein
MLDSHPPSDIFEELIQCGGGANNSTHNIQQDDHVAYWTDAHAYLPLHHACMKGASTDVLRALIHVYPASVLAVDTNQHTPLHLYTTTMTRSSGGAAEGGSHGSTNYTPPETLATNVTLLLGGSCSSGGGSGTQSSAKRGQGDEDNDDTVSSSGVKYGTPAQIRTATTGMLPLHYACAYGTTTRVLHVLAKA